MQTTLPTARRRLALVATFALLLSLVGAQPALAAPPTGSAQLLGGTEVLAGTENATYQIEVDYPDQSGLDAILDPKNPVNAVQIVPPSGILTDPVGDTEGWGWTRPANSDRLIFTGGEIAPGSTQVFDLTVDVERPHEDVVREFKVFLSDDEGANYTQASNGGLATSIRILEITRIELLEPTGVLDGTATTNQDNVGVEVEVFNAGAALPGGSPTIELETTLEGVQGSPTQTDDSTYGESTIFTFNPVSMPGSPGEIALTADSQATDASAVAIDDLETPLTLMRQLGLSYVSGSLTPQAVVPARVDPDDPPTYAFRARFNVSGDVDTTLDQAQTLFQINADDTDNSFEAALDTPAEILNDGGAVWLEFEEKAVDMEDRDDYPVDIQVVGTDENDADVDIVPGVNDTVDVDGLLPIALPEIIGDPSHLDSPDEGEEEVTSAGRTVDFGGEVQREDGTPCTDCVIDSAFLQYTFADGSSTDVPLTSDQISLTAGQISGSAEVTEAATNVRDVSLWVTAARTRVGEPAASDLLIVDNLAPTFIKATTGQVPDFYSAEHNDRRVIMVEIAESVKFDPSSFPLDWYVDDVSVTEVEAFKADGTPTHGHADFVVLHVSGDLPTNQTPQVRYEPGRTTPLDSNRGADQVQLDLEDAILTVVDGIVPDLADLLEVNDRIQQDDTFWTNTNAPSFTLGNIEAGDRVFLYRILDNGDREYIDDAEQDPNSDGVTLNDDGSYTFDGLDAEHDVATVAAEVIDPTLNSSGLVEFEVNFDFVDPTVDSVIQSGQDVTVTLSEPLTKDPDWVGRNFASDWAAESGEGFSKETYAAESVARTADDGAGQGQLNVTYEQAAASATFDRVIYEFLSELGDGKRYEDRAGNQLENFTHEMSP